MDKSVNESEFEKPLINLDINFVSYSDDFYNKANSEYKLAVILLKGHKHITRGGTILPNHIDALETRKAELTIDDNVHGLITLVKILSNELPETTPFYIHLHDSEDKTVYCIGFDNGQIYSIEARNGYNFNIENTSSLDNKINNEIDKPYELSQGTKDSVAKHIGLPFGQIEKMSDSELKRFSEIKSGHTFGNSLLKNTLKNKVIINFCKYMNNHFGTELVYNAEKESIPGYIDRNEVNQNLKKYLTL